MRKRLAGRNPVGGQSTHLPLKVNAAGVIPIIFASHLLLHHVQLHHSLERMM